MEVFALGDQAPTPSSSSANHSAVRGDFRAFPGCNFDGGGTDGTGAGMLVETEGA